MVWIWLIFGLVLSVGSIAFSSDRGKGASIGSFFMAGVSLFVSEIWIQVLCWCIFAVLWNDLISLLGESSEEKDNFRLKNSFIAGKNGVKHLQDP